MTLSHIVAFITGAGSGLGRATALRLASKNAKVIIADLDSKFVNEVVNSIGTKNAIPAVCDVCDEKHVRDAMNKAVNEFGRINVAVNCAGIAPPMKTLSKKGPHDLQQFAKVITINTIGTFNVSRLAAEQMALIQPDSDGYRGVIINTASVAAFEGKTYS